MIQPTRKHPSPYYSIDHQSKRRSVRKLLLLPAVGLVLACASCSEPAPEPPAPSVTDTAPVGAGLKVIGFAILGAAVVLVLGRMIR
jgi:hypothetical protein